MGFTLGDKTDRERNIILIRAVNPMLPETRDKTLVIPGRNGAWDFGADMEVRTFNLECAFIERSPAALQYAIESLARDLVDSFGRPRPIKLTLDYHSDREYTVRYAGSLDVERLYRAGSFVLPLVAFDPYANGPEEVIEVIITQSPTVQVVESEGEIRTAPVIVLSNEGSTTINNFRITNEYRLE